MATIKAIEAKSVHQIQSGQVIVDLCSVVKELVENGLDAGATSLDVRFRNNGLDSIEVQDNGAGIAPANYESVALKHHTSKLSSYDDLSSLHTFGFRGEALSSLCALSNFHIITAQAGEAPKGNRLDFEVSGRLKGTSVVACQKGTTACVENLFDQLPVRRKELAKNIKREYGKVIGLLQAYGCICTNVKFSVRNSMPKGKAAVVFSTNSNATTRENIANVYGAKTLSALVALDLDQAFQPSLTQMRRNDPHNITITVRGHISKPVFGEGRQTPDRQMFFVNGRPCGLPQVAKAINEVYKGFNVSQSPFIFADLQMDTNAYDVNVSPDKRTILLHNSAALIENLKSALTDLFERQDQTVPQSQIPAAKLPSFKQLNIGRQESIDAADSAESRRSAKTPDGGRLVDDSTTADQDETEDEMKPNRILHDHFRHLASTRDEPKVQDEKLIETKMQKERERHAEKVVTALAAHAKLTEGRDEYDDVLEMAALDEDETSQEPENSAEDIHVKDFDERMAEQQRARIIEAASKDPSLAEEELDQAVASQESAPEQPNIVQNAFDRIRPIRSHAEVAAITIGDKTTTKVIGSQFPKLPKSGVLSQSSVLAGPSARKTTKGARAMQFSQGLRRFGAPGTQGAGEDTSDGSSDAEDGSGSDTSNGLESDGAEDPDAPQTIPGQPSAKDSESDPDFIDDAEKKVEEEARVAALIQAAEASAAIPTKESLRRANKALKSGVSRDSTLTLSTDLALDLGDLVTQAQALRQLQYLGEGEEVVADATRVVHSEEERLSLTVSKADFPKMHIVGQFNLGFILTVRPKSNAAAGASSKGHDADELFIIDQHASDEKYNFERLQAETVVGNQRLVRPVTLDLTAVEEEIVLENLSALEKNGFVVEVDTSGDLPVGSRCKLLSLPLSKEVIFGIRDFEELIHLLAEWQSVSPDGESVPRPTKVRKMFAMRACRSSIMIGKTLAKRQMKGVLEHMGQIDKPWNCPHGRPTMRHLTSLDQVGGWKEGDEALALQSAVDGDLVGRWREGDVWRGYLD